MDCKWLEAELVKGKSYAIEKSCKKYLANRMNIKYEAKEEEKPVYIVEGNQKRYGVCYCVRYRPVGILEWILARGWWNDKGIWTEDGIFNDGII